jgi:hypothetical protein
VKEGSTPNALAARLAGHTAGLAVDMDQVMARYGEEIMGGISQFEQLAGSQQMPELYQMMMSMYVEGVSAVLDQSKTAFVTADLSDGVLGIDVGMTAKTGTEAAKLIASSGAAPASLLGLFTKPGFLAAEVHLSPEAISTLYMPFVDLFAPMLDEETVGILRKSLTCWDSVAYSIGLADGLSFSAVMHLTDAEAYAETMDGTEELTTRLFDEMLPDLLAEAGGGVPPISFDFREDEGFTHEGTEVRSWSLGVTIAGGRELPPEAVALRNRLLGGERLVFHSAAVGDHAVMAMGPGAKAEVQALIGKVKGGATAATPARIKAAMPGLPKNVNALIYMDLGEIAKFVASLDVVPMNDEVRALLRTPPADLSIGGYMAMNGDTGIYGYRLNLATIIDYVKAIIEASK